MGDYFKFCGLQPELEFEFIDAMLNQKPIELYNSIEVSIFNLFLKNFGILNQANGKITQIKRLSWWSCQLNEYPSHKEPLKKIATSFWKKKQKRSYQKNSLTKNGY